jgi:hypothetical protein
MVYGFAKQSGGHAEIESTPDIGTTVRLYLPESEVSDGKQDKHSATDVLEPNGSERLVSASIGTSA